MFIHLIHLRRKTRRLYYKLVKLLVKIKQPTDGDENVSNELTFDNQQV